MRSLLFVCLGFLALSACGQGEEGSLVVSKGPAPGPYVTLGPTGLGSLERGSPATRVLEVFGRPDRREIRNLGLAPAPELGWTWRLEGGELELHFNARQRVLTGYCTDSPELATADGVRVGKASTGMLARRYGDRLVPSPIGPPPGPEPHTLLLSASQPGTYPALAFTVSERETVLEICGGDPRPAGD